MGHGCRDSPKVVTTSVSSSTALPFIYTRPESQPWGLIVDTPWWQDVSPQAALLVACVSVCVCVSMSRLHLCIDIVVLHLWSATEPYVSVGEKPGHPALSPFVR